MRQVGRETGFSPSLPSGGGGGGTYAGKGRYAGSLSMVMRLPAHHLPGLLLMTPLSHFRASAFEDRYSLWGLG